MTEACSAGGEIIYTLKNFGCKARRKDVTKKTYEWMEDNIKIDIMGRGQKGVD